MTVTSSELYGLSAEEIAIVVVATATD